MANNRLYIGCKKCREHLYLDKHFGGPFTISEKTRIELNNFLEQHAYCGHDWVMTFELFDENGDDEKYSYYMDVRDESEIADEEV